MIRLQNIIAIMLLVIVSPNPKAIIVLEIFTVALVPIISLFAPFFTKNSILFHGF